MMDAENNILRPTAALSDWLALLQGPASPLFEKEANFEKEWKRLFRLLLLVLSMLGAVIVVFSLGLKAANEDWRSFAAKSQYSVVVLLIGALLSVPYAFILAPLVRIRITFVQTFFTILLLGLPWVPLVALVWALGAVSPRWGLLVTIFFYMLILIPLHNFCRGVSIISNRKVWRVVVSLVIPSTLVLAVFIANVVWE